MTAILIFRRDEGSAHSQQGQVAKKGERTCWQEAYLLDAGCTVSCNAHILTFVSYLWGDKHFPRCKSLAQVPFRAKYQTVGSMSRLANVHASSSSDRSPAEAKRSSIRPRLISVWVSRLPLVSRSFNYTFLSQSHSHNFEGMQPARQYIKPNVQDHCLQILSRLLASATRAS